MALTLAYPAKKATIVGFLPGLTTPGGVTHQAVDDIGLMATLPNMTVIEAADATDMESVLDSVYDLPGPVYVRGLRGEVPQLFDSPLQVGKHRTLFPGDDVLVVVSGHLTHTVVDIVSRLRSDFPGLGAVNVSTLKPFDDEELIHKLVSARHVVTVENHWTASGLGAIVSRVLHTHRASTLLHTVGVGDTFTHGGSAGYLEDFYGIGPTHIERAIRMALGEDVSHVGPTQSGGDIRLTEGVAEGL